MTMLGPVSTLKRAVREALLLDFSKEEWDPRVSFSRPTTAIYYDADGVRREAAIDEPRPYYVEGSRRKIGFLREEMGTNSVTNGETPWTNNTIRGEHTEQGVFAGYPMAKFVPNTEANSHYTQANFGGTLSTTEPQSVQFVVKYAGLSAVRATIFSGGSSTAATAHVSFVNGVGSVTWSTGATVTTRNLADGALLVKVDGFYPLDGTTSNLLRLVYWDSASNSSNIAGNGVDGVWVGGFCWERAAPNCSTYIPTNGSIASRQADSVQLTGEAFAASFNRAANTTLAVAIHDGVNSTSQNPGCIFSLDNGSLTERIQSRFNGAGTVTAVAMTDGLSMLSGSAGNYTLRKLQAVAIAVQANDAAASVNGTIGASTQPASSALPNPDRLVIGNASPTAINGFNGCIAVLAMWKRRLSNEQLNRLTKI